MKKKRPTVLTIAGFDPSGGAGILADIKTFEQLKVYGMAVQTANTVQNELSFYEVNWIDRKTIFKQIDCLLEKHNFCYIKIGLIPDLEFLQTLTEHPKLKESKFIWDTVLSSSSGFDFNLNTQELEQILPKIFMITPNLNEVKKLAQKESAEESSTYLAQFTNVYLKGGHAEENIGKDYLYTKEGKVYPFRNHAKKATEKHGSGCVLSSALTAHFAKEYPLIKACLKSKDYTKRVLESNPSLLGYHKQ